MSSNVQTKPFLNQSAKDWQRARAKSNYEFNTQRVVAVTLFCLAAVSAATLFTGIAWGLLGWSNPLIPPAFIFSGFLLSQIFAAFGVVTLRSARCQMGILKDGNAEKFIHSLQEARSWSMIEWAFKYKPQTLEKHGVMTENAAQMMREKLIKYGYIKNRISEMKEERKTCNLANDENYKFLKEAKRIHKDQFSQFKEKVILPNLASWSLDI